MPGGLFNQKNELRLLAQIFNGLNMMYISYHYYTNPDAILSEDGFSFVSSLINFYALRENTDILTDLFATYVSAANMSSIFTHAALGATQMPLAANLYQSLLLNPGNILVGLFQRDEDKETEHLKMK